MTKKLNWRLQDLPTGDEVAQLVEQKVITVDEARDILFKDQGEQKKDEEVKALKDQIEFLQDLVEKLSSRNNWSTFTYIPSYPIRYWHWSDRSPVWMSTTSSSGSSAVTVNSANLLGSSTVGDKTYN